MLAGFIGMKSDESPAGQTTIGLRDILAIEAEAAAQERERLRQRVVDVLRDRGVSEDYSEDGLHYSRCRWDQPCECFQQAMDWAFADPEPAP